MAATEIPALRTQILSNAQFLLQTKSTRKVSIADSETSTASHDNGNGNSNGHNNNPTHHENLDIVVFGHNSKFTAALMMGLTPAIEGDVAGNPEAAMRKLFLATAELLHNYVPSLGAHQRIIHGGGMFNEDLISAELIEASKKV